MQNDLRWMLNRLERDTDSFLAVVSKMSEAQRQFRPSANAWNALQVTAHLVTVERGLLDIPAERRGSRTWRSSLIHAVMLGGLILPIRIGVPAPGARPADTPDLQTLHARWREARELLRGRLEALEDDRISFSRHPLSGPMNAHQTIAFYRAHLHHHRYQIARIRRAPGFLNT